MSSSVRGFRFAISIKVAHKGLVGRTSLDAGHRQGGAVGEYNYCCFEFCDTASVSTPLRKNKKRNEKTCCLLIVWRQTECKVGDIPIGIGRCCGNESGANTIPETCSEQNAVCKE